MKPYHLDTSISFCHASFLHLAFNCLALEGFGSAASIYLRQLLEKQDPGQLESTSAYPFYDFLRFSREICFSRITHRQRSNQIPQAPAASSTTISTASSSKSSPGSLGASGAVYSCVTLVALAYPGSQISLIFPPMMPIDIQTGVMGLVALDMFGIYRGWRMCDHWAHLGGAAFGAMYYYCGPGIWSLTRGVV
ncbi:hypothetical protein GYMLUDRAFT_261492 [Collybiopsis luxurians FD-317 M1]|uniref:Peptidase S54 rhomboid domain-containing protein n=1 Tax=Collybiopsis luxurians FD-317 M1 TaxID=944289 RepID=A0A0D0CNX7_9AGAR|nr:hypothetical protein GYMLUDRAFT_261492 [Collybiopsis luxurians FD-317 M1]